MDFQRSSRRADRRPYTSRALLIQVGDGPGPPAGGYRGLYHIGIENGPTREDIERCA